MYIQFYYICSTLTLRDMKTIQTATSIKDFEEMAATCTNMVEGEYITRCAARFIGDQSRYWMRDFCANHLSRFSKCSMYEILMGVKEGDKKNYYYVPNTF